MNFLTLIKKFGTRFVVMLRWRSIFHHEKGVAISFELRTRLTQFSFGIPVVNLLRPLNLWFNLVDWFQFVSGFSSTDLSFVCLFDSVHPSRYFHIKETRWILQNLFFTGTTSSPLLLPPPRWFNPLERDHIAQLDHACKRSRVIKIWSTVGYQQLLFMDSNAGREAQRSYHGGILQTTLKVSINPGGNDATWPTDFHLFLFLKNTSAL